ncbi:hypothetical protein TNCV_1341771 [Trichonephila clavipes]|uniref:Uncharacterized protein n=1 Tax=Trichonephila clavipes TaxID=2585209 RepID=A0A8X6V5I5_TRICX|nr:hypothetical protein TNCV_1341771 [Trichonephila clavipes]
MLDNKTLSSQLHQPCRRGENCLTREPAAIRYASIRGVPSLLPPEQSPVSVRALDFSDWSEARLGEVLLGL